MGLDKNTAKNIKDSISDLVGSATYSSFTYKEMSIDNFYAGYERGESTSRVIAGDNSKPITLYTQNASEWWKIWEYKVGINVNIGDGGFNIGTGLGETTFNFCVDNTSVEFLVGTKKLGFTVSKGVDFKNGTAESYAHYYIRPWTIAATAVLVYAAGGIFAPASSAPLLPV